MKTGSGRIGAAAAVAMLSGAACALAQADRLPDGPNLAVIAAPGPQTFDASGPQTGISGAYLSTIEHASASPAGYSVVVGRMTGAGVSSANNQGVWVRGLNGQWTLRSRSGTTELAGLPGSVLGALIGTPIVNGRGEVLVVASVTFAATTNPPGVSPALVRLGGDGQARLLLRFNAVTGPGVPMGMTTGVSFAGPYSDSWRFGERGAAYASMMVGMFGQFGDGMMARTFIQRTSAMPVPPLAVAVGSAGTGIALNGDGFAVQRIGTSSYGQNDELSGLLMFDSWGIPNFVVRDRTTPVEGLAGMVVLTTSINGTQDTQQSPTSRLGTNGLGTVAFLGRYGAQPTTTSMPGMPTVPVQPVQGTRGAFVKSPGQGARLIAEITAGGSDVGQGLGVPGMAGHRFAAANAPVVNAQGRLVFSATVAGPTGSRASIWTTDDTGALRPVAMVEPAALDRETFATLGAEPTINAAGQVLFTARINAPLGSAGATSADALCAFDPVAGVSVLARSGRVVELPDGRSEVITLGTMPEIGGRAMSGTGNADGLPTLLTNDGKVIFRANVAGVGQMVLGAEIDATSGACCVGSTCEVRARVSCGHASTRFVGVNTACTSNAAAGGCCAGDYDQSGTIGTQDLFDYLGAWLSGNRMADTDFNDTVSLDDLMLFVSSYVSGC